MRIWIWILATAIIWSVDQYDRSAAVAVMIFFFVAQIGWGLADLMVALINKDD